MEVLTDNEPLDMRPRFAKGPLYQSSVNPEQIITPAHLAANRVAFGGNDSGNVDEQAGTMDEIAHPDA